MKLALPARIDAMPENDCVEQLHSRYHRQMLVVADRILHNQAEAEDAVQNALMGVARNFDRLPRDARAERAYVLTAAKNAALSMLPEKARRDALVDISQVDVPSGEDLFQQVMDCQDYALLLRSIRQLAAHYREVLMLVYVYDHTIQEAARILGRKEDTVRKQLHRGREILIEICKKEGLNYEVREPKSL